MAGTKNQTRKKGAAQRQFEFVNATTPDRNKDPDMRRLVRKLVRNQFLRDERNKIAKSSTPSSQSKYSSGLSTECPLARSKTGESTDYETVCRELRDCTTISKPVGYPTALCVTEYAVEMQPRTQALLSRYLRYAGRMLPRNLHLQSNPLSSPEWFKFAVTDAAMLHAMLYSGAIYLVLLAGKKESEDSMHHLGETISIVNKRLKNSTTNIDDSTIGAPSCLALGGVG
jgi:hypothetical protein